MVFICVAVVAFVKAVGVTTGGVVGVGAIFFAAGVGAAVADIAAAAAAVGSVGIAAFEDFAVVLIVVYNWKM